MNQPVSLYTSLGGATILHKFVNHLYRYMDEADETKHVRDMHPNDLNYANDRLFKFLSGMLGGPQLYLEEFGHPRLRRRHMTFNIGNTERDQWLMCAQHAANQLDIDDEPRHALMTQLTQMANHLRNQSA